MSDPDEWVLAEAGYAGPGVVLPEGPIEPERVQALRVLSLTRLPERIRELTSLRRLSLGPAAGRALVASISAAVIPSSVRVLEILTGGSATSWPAGVVLPHVTGLRADGPLMLTREALPDVRAVVIRPARNNQNLDEILAVPSLRELHLLTAPAGVFGRIGHLPLTGLGLLGGALGTLDGIEGMTALRSLRLHNLRSLRSLEPLAGTGVETLEVRFCPGITKIGRLPDLRRLSLVGCGTPDLAGIGDDVTLTVTP